MDKEHLLVSSVVRGANQGSSHGGLFLVDMVSNKFKQVFDHNDKQIDFAGRGADRGLRGIAKIDKRLFIAASDEIFIFNEDFVIVGSIKHRLLKHVHEICYCDDGLLVTSTGFDCILLFDVKNLTCLWGLVLHQNESGKISAKVFDPNDTSHLPRPANTCHINMVSYSHETIYIGGLKLSNLLSFNQNSGLKLCINLPLGTHNAQPYNNGFIFNNTSNNAISWTDSGQAHSIALPDIPAQDVDNHMLVNKSIARANFARGMSIQGEYVTIGISPSTLIKISLKTKQIVKRVQLIKDIRCAIHGIHPW